MKLEEAYILEVTKRMDCGDSKEYPLTPVVIIRLHHINCTMLQLIMLMITIVILIKIITIKKKEIQNARTNTGEKNKYRILAWKPERRKPL